MIKRIAVIFGVVFLLVGIMGFIPALAPLDAATGQTRLFGVFAVDAMHNGVHLLTGLVALAVGFTSEHASRNYFRIFGVIYLLVAAFGFFMGRGEMFGMMAHNMADAVLHLAIAIVSLALGFMPRLTGEHPHDDRHHPA